jgi:large exoprotein involved in heme utilization and adhesion
LFLINPNGIIFGPNASLDIGGSFVGTTANSIQFGEQGFFSASAPDVPPLLTVNPSALLFTQIAARSIENRSTASAGLDPSGSFDTFGLRVPEGQSLLLVGGDIKADGGGIVAFGGRIDLGAVSGAGAVGLNLDGNNLSLNFPDDISRADVSLTNEAGFIVAAGGGGSITITAQNIDILEESGLFGGMLSNLGSEDAQAGDITLNATGAVSLDNSSAILNSVFSDAVGNSGDINITTGSLYVTNVAQIRSQTIGRGNAGNITIVAHDTVSFDGRDSTDSFPSAAFTSVESGAVGNGGNINITTGSLSITNRAQLLSNTEGTGNAGNIFVEARDQVSLLNSIIISEVSEEGGVGNGGDIDIKTGSLLLKDGSALLADMENQGNAGDITIEARDAVILEGRGPSAFASSSELVPSQITATIDPVEPDVVGEGGNISIFTGSLSINDGFISANTFAQGNAGSINITTRNLSGTNGAQITASTSGKGNASSVTITASDTISFDGENSQGFPSGAFSTVEEGAVGNGGNINITAGSLEVNNGAELTTTSEGSGAAGNIEVAADSIRLDDQAALRADTTAGQGDIFLRSLDLVLRDESNITTDATGIATGGNITINTGVITLEDSNITANAEEASGGQVRINAQGILRTEESDITARSDLGAEFSGTVELNTPDVDLSRGLVNLPVEVVDASNQIATGCPAGEENKFTITGRGGLPPNPNEPLTGDNVLTDWATLDSDAENRSSAAPDTNSTKESVPTQIVEANGWMINNKGEVVLTAAVPTATLNIPWLPDSDCNAPEPAS